MPFAADTLSVVKDVFTVVGIVITALAAVFGVWLALRRRAEKRRERELQDGIKISDKFAHLANKVDNIQNETDSIKNQYREFKARVTQDHEELVDQIDDLRSRLDQQVYDTAQLKQDIVRVKERLDRLDQDFQLRKETMAEKYMTIASYQNDLLMWSKSFGDLRQSIRDLHLILSKRSGK
jgi:peptidoglycan hydrolase CwlO-like protein